MSDTSSQSLFDDYVTEQQFADSPPRKHIRTVMRWRERGEGPPFVRLGKTVLYRKAAIREWLLAKERH